MISRAFLSLLNVVDDDVDKERSIRVPYHSQFGSKQLQKLESTSPESVSMDIDDDSSSDKPPMVKRDGKYEEIRLHQLLVWDLQTQVCVMKC